MKTDRMIYQVEETREKIIHIAKKMFLEKGLETTKMKEIADEINISRTSLYRYFLDKEFLSLAVFKILIEDIQMLEGRIRTACEKMTNGLLKVETLLRLRWLSSDMVKIYRFISEFDTIYSESRISDEFRKEFEELFIMGASDLLLQEYITEGQNDGSIRSDIPAQFFGDIINNGVRAMHHRFLLRGTLLFEFKGKDLNDVMEEYLKILIYGVKKF